MQFAYIRILSLHICVEQKTRLWRVAIRESFAPLETLEFEIEVKNEKGVSEIDISKASILKRAQVHRQVEVIKGVFVPLLDHVQNVCLRVPDWDVLYHDGSQVLSPVQNREKVDLVKFE